jgi:hypothetical protein
VVSSAHRPTLAHCALAEQALVPSAHKPAVLAIQSVSSVQPEPSAQRLLVQAVSQTVLQPMSQGALQTPGIVGGPSSVLQSDIGNVVSPTFPWPTSWAQLRPAGELPDGLDKTHPISFAVPGAGTVVDEVLHAKATTITPPPTSTPT